MDRIGYVGRNMALSAWAIVVSRVAMTESNSELSDFVSQPNGGRRSAGTVLCPMAVERTGTGGISPRTAWTADQVGIFEKSIGPALRPSGYGWPPASASLNY